MKRILNHYKILFTFSIIFLLASCETIPPGTPPEGSIVNISHSTDEVMNRKEAVNTMITALIASPEISSHKTIPKIKFEPPRSFRKKFKDEYLFDFLNITLKVYKNLIASKLIEFSAVDSQSDYLFISTFKRKQYHYELERLNVVFEWTLSLNSPKNPNETLWSHTVTLFMPEKNKKQIKEDEEVQDY